MWVHECLFVESSSSQKAVQHKEKLPPSKMWAGKGTSREVQMSLCREKTQNREVMRYLNSSTRRGPGGQGSSYFWTSAGPGPK